jgi:RimJ/RimL family protein N-acetyltransferase
MRLSPLDDATLPLAAGWIAAPENWRWLDFRGPGQPPDVLMLTAMSRRGSHCMRVYGAPGTEAPVGLVVLDDVSTRFGTASLWYVLGDKRHAGQGLTTAAVGAMLRLGFGELGLETVQAWVAEGNDASIRVLERNGFRRVGRYRRAHVVDGRWCDRLLYDLLASEHGAPWPSQTP